MSMQLQPYATASNSGVLEYEETTSACESRENEATGIIVHGLLGSGRNWRNFSRTLANDLAQTSGRSVSLWSASAFRQAPPRKKATKQVPYHWQASLPQSSCPSHLLTEH